MANSGYDLLNGWEAMEWQAQGMRNVRDYRRQTPTAHPQFGSLNDKDELTMPFAIKPAGLSKDQVISQFGSIDAWVASYKPDGSNSWSRSAYYQMLEDGYSEAEAQKGTIISSFFKRYSLRANSTYNANKYFTIGQNSNIAIMVYSNKSKYKSLLILLNHANLSTVVFAFPWDLIVCRFDHIFLVFL